MFSIYGILLVTFICGLQAGSGNISESFKASELVPDILSQPPASLLNVEYTSGAVVSEGNVLTVPEVATAPSVSWGALDGVFYTVLMIDPDAPSRTNPLLRSYLHWLVINICNDDVTTGNTVADYITPGPPPGAGLHRYMFLVYRQSSKLDYTDFVSYAASRKNFSPTDFAAQYNLGDPIGGNFYQTETAETTLF